MDVFGKLTAKISPEKRRRAIIALGTIGLLLIFLSSFLPTDSVEKKAENTDEPPPASNESAEDYRKTLEQELCSIISAIDGAGSVKVMITMESTTEDVFAVDKTESENRSGSESSPDGSVQRSEENEYVIVKGTDGSESTVVKKQRMPEVRGVLVVCDGAASAVVREKITAAAAGALGIERSRVVVTK